MGTLVECQCSCGYQGRAAVGGSMNTFRTYDPFPALCHQCKDVVSVNTKNAPHTCPQCKTGNVDLYLDPDLSRLKSERTIASSFDRHLRAANYLCPKCGEFALRFRATIMVD